MTDTSPEAVEKLCLALNDHGCQNGGCGTMKYCICATALDAADTLRAISARIAALEAERNAWMETARLHLSAETAFLSWLHKAGEHMIAEGVTLCDDGKDSGGVLAAKVPECAALLQARAERAEAEVARLHGITVGATASLAAAISLLERGGKRAAPSGKMFAQMLMDYKASLKRARAALREKLHD